MAVALDYQVNSVAYNSVTLVFAGTNTALYPNMDIQYSTRPDFQFVPSPLFSIAIAGGTYTVTPLNQGNAYFFRVRDKTAAGVVNPWSNTIVVYTPISVARVTTPDAIMVNPAIIVPPAPITQIILNGGVAGRPGSNLLGDSPAEQAWFTGTTIADFETSGEPLDTFALLNTNLPANASWRVQASQTQAGLDAPDYTGAFFSFQASAGLPGRPGYHGLIRLAAPLSYRWWRMRLSGAGDRPPGSLTTASFLVAGLARTAKNIAADKVESPLDYGNVERLRDGSADRRFGFRGRRVEFDIALLTEAQWETQFAGLFKRIGLTDPVLAVPNSKGNAFLHDRILFGPMSQNRVTQPFGPRFTKSVAIESVI